MDDKTKVRLLCTAIEGEDLRAVRRMLASGFPTSHPEVAQSAAMCAVARDNTRIIDALHEVGGIEVSQVDPLFVDAITQGAYKAARRMLDLGADPTQHVGPSPNSDRSALLYVVARGATPLANTILGRLTPEQRDNELVTAVRKGFARGVRILLDAGADPSQHVDGQTLLQIAHPEGEEVKRLLRSLGTISQIESAMEAAGEESRERPSDSSFAL